MNARFPSKTPIALAVLLALGTVDASAQPAPNQLPVQRPGGAAINARVGPVSSNSMTITQGSSANNRALVEWSSFSIGSNARVNIVQPNTQSVLVNRVTGDGHSAASASEIYGTMSANGRVFLVNPAGVVFGPGAQVNVGSLVATSLDLDRSMTDNNYTGFIDGKEVLLNSAAGRSDMASISVLGSADGKTPQIQVTEGGSIVLLSHDRVAQNGIVNAPGGNVNLSSASAVSLLPVGRSGFVEVLVARVPTQSGGVSLGNGSQTLARNGSITIGAQNKESGARSDSIAIAGTVNADSSTGKAGNIHIDAGPDGSVTLSEGAAISASSTATGATGGQVSLLGSTIDINRGDIANPQVLADGKGGGGTIVVGNDNTRSIKIDERTLLSADATEAGQGGDITVRAMYNNPPTGTAPAVARTNFGVAEVYGQLHARGGAKGGNGGHIETSGMALATALTNPVTGITQRAQVDASARAAGSAAGTWTLDPYDVTISTSASVGVNGSFNPTALGANVQASDISAALNAGTNVDISTAAVGSPTNTLGDITIASDVNITRTTGSAPVSLTLHANNSIVANGVIIDASGAGPVNVSFLSDLDGNGTGHIALLSGSIQTGGGSLTLSGGINPATGFATGNAQNAGVLLQRTNIDTRGSVQRGAGDVVIRGQSGSAGTPMGVQLDADMIVGNLNVTGLASHNTAVSLNGSDITTSAGTLDIRGVALRADAISAQLVGVDTGGVRMQLGTGSLILAGRGDDSGSSTSGVAVGLRLSDVQISSDTNSTGRITLAGQAVGNSAGSGIVSNGNTNIGIIINANALASGSAPAGANIVIGGLSDTPASSIGLNSGFGMNIATSGSVNIRPLGVSTSGALTEQVATPITIVPGATTGLPAAFIVNANLLRTPGANNGGISAGQGFVIGSAAHTGAITVQSSALTQHSNVALTLQNEGGGSQGIALGNNNTVGSLGLLTAGNVTQTAGGITVGQNLVIRGGNASTVTLTDANNQIGVVAFDPPSTLSLHTAGNLTVDAASIQTFNAGTGAFNPLAITSSIGGNTALLHSAGNVLINRPISMAGTGASQLDIVTTSPTGTVTFAQGATLSTSTAGRWRVWAPTVVNAPSTGAKQNLYGCVFGDITTCSVSGATISAAGNQLLFPNRPTVVVAANPTAGYSGLSLPPLGYTATGLVNGDTAASAFTGALTTNATSGSPVGTYGITQGTLSSPLGYIVTFQPSSLTLARPNLDRLGVTREMLQSNFKFEQSSDVYGRNLDQPYICTAASVIRGSLADSTNTDPLASEWGKVRNQPQLSGCLNLTDGGQCSAF